MLLNQSLSTTSLPLQAVQPNYLTPWFMEPDGSMPHSQRPSNNPYPEVNQNFNRYTYRKETFMKASVWKGGLAS
jgi:hypothetical protein